MRIFSLALVVVLSLPALAADLTVKVLDPQGGAVAGAQVQLLADQNKIVATQITSAEGLAVFQRATDSSYKVKVLAPGFAAETAGVESSELTVSLRLATAAETVVVSGT